MADVRQIASHEDRYAAAMQDRRDLEAQRLELENEKMRRSLALKDRPLRRLYHDEKLLVWMLVLGAVIGVVIGLAFGGVDLSKQ